jgi:acetyltransferase-like isoleucine patch superfamily enzyme
VKSIEEIAVALSAYHELRRREFSDRWNRAVPFGDEVVDRWEKARLLGFGDGASIYDSALVLGDVKVGRGTWVGPFTVLDGSGGLTIGETCSISAGVQIYSHDSVKWALSGGRAEYDLSPVVIGDHSYIGPMSVVTRGVTIGRHCVVGANSVVNKSIPDFSIAVGSTCRVVGRVVIGADDSVELRYGELPPGFES